MFKLLLAEGEAHRLECNAGEALPTKEQFLSPASMVMLKVVGSSFPARQEGDNYSARAHDSHRQYVHIVRCPFTPLCRGPPTVHLCSIYHHSPCTGHTLLELLLMGRPGVEAHGL